MLFPNYTSYFAVLTFLYIFVDNRCFDRHPISQLKFHPKILKFMKTITKLLCAALAFGGLLSPVNVGARVVINEIFDYAAGPLVGNSAWHRFNTNNTGDPVQLAGTGLTYAGYQDTATGKSAVLVPGASSSEKPYLAFPSWDDRITSGCVYLSLLMNVTSPGNDSYCFAIGSLSKTNFGKDDKSGSDNLRIFTKSGSTAGKFCLGFSKNKSTGTYIDAEYDIGTTYLVVLKYEFVDGSNNDVCSIWVNPDTDAIEPTAALSTNVGADFSTNNGINILILRQGGNASRSGAAVAFDALRLATSWAELFGKSSGEDPEPKPTDGTITVSQSSLDFGTTLQGVPVSKTVVIKAANISGNVSLSTSASDFNITPADIPAADAMTEEGVVATVTMTASTSGEKSGKVIISASGAENSAINLSGKVTAIETISSAAFVNNNAGDGTTLYRYVGLGATVTYVDAVAKRLYAQDVVGGICFDYSAIDTASFAVNDKLKNALGTIVKQTDGSNVFKILSSDYTLTHDATPKEPLEVSASEVALDPTSYIFRLLTLTDDVAFDQSGDGVSFAAKAHTGTSGTTSVNVQPFAGTDIIGTTVPSNATVTGISHSVNGVTLRPRNAADVAAKPSQYIDIKINQVFTDDFANIKTRYKFATLTVISKGLTYPGTVYVSGQNAKAFTVDNTTIPAGSHVTTVNVFFRADYVGCYEGFIGIETYPSTLNTGVTLSATAIDPNNPPTIEPTPEALEDFTAEVGTTQDQKLRVFMAKAPVTGKARIVGGSGAFRITNSALFGQIITEITVTFAPTAAGVFTDAIELSAPGAPTVTIPLKGVATGTTPTPEKEGDEFVPDETNPLTYMVEPFDSAVKNKPLKIDRWLNVAQLGTRAWWGYTSDDDEKTAKFTGYDFFASEDSRTLATLITPPLDYSNTATDNRFLTFRIKGQNLSDDIEITPLTVIEIERSGEDYFARDLGVGISTGSAYNDTWQEFVVDLDGLDLSDIFFIGFNYDGMRGKNNSVVWYLDDVTWGRNDIPFIRPLTKTESFTCNANEEHISNFTINGIRLTGDINLKMVGSHASNFTLSTATLPATGGNFTVTFRSEATETLHTGYVELSSDGAPKSYIEIYATTNNTQGVADISAKAISFMTAYTPDGLAVAHNDNGPIDTDTLTPGIYIIVTRYADGTTSTRKAAIR